MVLPGNRKRFKRKTKSKSNVVGILASCLIILSLIFSGLLLQLLSSRNDNNNDKIDIVTTAAATHKDNDKGPKEHLVALDLKLNDNDIIRIRMKLFDHQAPDAARYIRQVIREGCKKCTIYRGEPVPEYWGSPDYPDRYFNGGRWGPPYALIQGQLVKADANNAINAKAEPNRPIIERGMVAWAGGQGGPHFFIAMAHHPEWEHGHTVFAQVLSDDMKHLDHLVQTLPLQTTNPQRLPIVTNFVEAIPFTIQEIVI